MRRQGSARNPEAVAAKVSTAREALLDRAGRGGCWLPVECTVARRILATLAKSESRAALVLLLAKPVGRLVMGR